MPLMKFRRSTGMLGVVLLTLCFAAGSRAAAAQSSTTVTSADVQRLQERIADVSKDVGEARMRDAALGAQLQSELDTAKEKAADFKLNLQRNEPVDRNEFIDVRDRVENISRRAHGEPSQP